jgi:hypothetical protein
MGYLGNQRVKRVSIATLHAISGMVLQGHDFSRAVRTTKARALAPEGVADYFFASIDRRRWGSTNALCGESRGQCNLPAAL